MRTLFAVVGNRPPLPGEPAARISLPLLIAPRSMHAVAQSRDFVLYLKLTAFQLYDDRVVSGGMRESVRYFLFQGPVPRLEYLEICFQRHG
jgi:hypothetical protein